MYLQADAMADTVREVVAITRIGNHLASGGVDFPDLTPGRNAAIPFCWAFNTTP